LTLYLAAVVQKEVLVVWSWPAATVSCNPIYLGKSFLLDGKVLVDCCC